MTIIHHHVEKRFAQATQWVYDRKIRVLLVVLLATAALAAQLPKLTIDTRDESFFHDDDPTLLAYNSFRDTFGQDDTFVIALQPDHGLTPEVMQTLVALHRDLATSVPYLDEISSLVNARIVRAEGDILRVEELMPAPPRTDARFQDLLARVDRYPLYENLLISRDRSIVFILIRARAVMDAVNADPMDGFGDATPTAQSPATAYLSNEQNVEIHAAIERAVDKYRQRGITFHLSGTPAFVAEIQNAILQDLRIMVPLSFAVITIFLWALFRRLSGVIYPVVTVAFSLIASLGIMALTGIAISNAIQILPTFLVVVGVGDSVHILTIFYRNYRIGGDKRRAIIDAVGFAGLPVLMTSITTALGLFSFAWADVAIIAQLGCVAPVGVMLAFVYTVILLPALIGVFPVKRPRAIERKHPLPDRLFNLIARTTTRRPIIVAGITGLLLVIAAIGAAKVRFSHNSLTWLPAETAIRQSTEFLDRVNGGTIMLEVTIDSKAAGGLHDPDLLGRIDAAALRIPTINVHGVQAAKATSLADVLKEIHRALNEDKDDAYAVPTTRDLIAQELLLFESSGSDDLEEVVAGDYRVGRLSILAPFADAILYKDYVDAIEKYLRRQLPDSTLKMTGHMVIFVQMIERFITSMAKSYIIALVVITGLMVLLIGRIGIGLMSMVANIAPVLCIFGIMGFASIRLDMATIMIGSIVLGLVVDDTIHFLHHFRKAYDETLSVESAVRETLITTGRALVITSLVLSGGFFIYSASFLNSNIRFGWLSGSAVLLALAADLFLVPALLNLALRKKAALAHREHPPTATATVRAGRDTR